MIWAIIIGIIVFVLIRFIISLDKDNYDLQGQTLSEKFKFIISSLNEVAFNGNGKITVLGKRSFNLYQDGENQIIHFNYSTGHLTIIWKYKYFQKEVVLEKQFNDVRNISLFDQQKIADVMIKEMRVVIANHKNSVTGNISHQVSDELYVSPKKEEKTNLSDGIKDIINSNSQLKDAILNQDKSEIEKVLHNMSAGTLDSLLSEIAYSDQQAELFRRKAIDKMYDEPKDYQDALRLIDKGLSFNDKETEPFLYNLKAECHILLDNYSIALNEMNKAINSLEQNCPDKYYNISDFYKERAKIKEHLNDSVGAQQDKKTSEEYYKLYEQNKPLEESEDDLPF